MLSYTYLYDVCVNTKLVFVDTLPISMKQVVNGNVFMLLNGAVKKKCLYMFYLTIIARIYFNSIFQFIQNLYLSETY